MDTRADDEERGSPARPVRRATVSAASGLLKGLLKRALSGLRAPAASREKLVFEAFEPRVLLAGDPVTPRIDGSLDVAGEVDRYAFTLSEDLRVVFDSLTDNGNIRWSLDGPRGAVDSGRPFSQSDSYERGGNVVYDLPAGEYMLTVDGVGDTTGAYGFRLIDINKAQELTLGETVTAELSPANETDAYRFSVVAGQRFFIDRLSNGGDIYWRLIDPYGRTAIDRQSMNSDIGELTLPLDGSYTLLIEGRAYTGGTAGYSFSVVELSDPPPLPLTLGEPVAGRIDGAGLRQSYTFTLAEARRVLFDSLTNNPAINWSLSGPRGALVSGINLRDTDSWESYYNAGAFPASNPALLLGPGDYTLTIDGAGDAVGDYRFALRDLATAEVLTPGVGVSGSLGDAAQSQPSLETRLYRFDAAAGERFFFDRTGLSGDNFSLRLIGPDGRALVGPQWFSDDVDVFTTAVAGTYTVALEGRIYNTQASNFAFTLHKVIDGSGTLNLGATVSGSIEQPGQRQLYGFTLAADSWVVFDSLSGSSALTWSLSGPRGDEVVGRTLRNSDSGELGGSPAMRLQAGSYTLTVDGSGDATGAFALRLLDLADAEALPYGRAVSSSLDPGNLTRAYRIAATAGDEVVLDWQSMSGGNAYWRLLDPTGRLVFGPDYMNSDRGPLTLLLSGDYTLLVEGRSFETAPVSYAFTLTLNGQTPIAAPTGTAILKGQRVEGTLSAAGERDDYLIELAGPTRLYFDSFAPGNNGAFRWSLVGPRGVEVDGRSIYYSESWEYGAAPPVVDLPLAGTYQVRIQADGATTGAYAFRVLDLADATALTPGTQVDATLNPGNETDVYRFDAQAGERFFFDARALSPNNGNWVSWTLLDPQGRLVFGPTGLYANNDVDVTTLARSGTYTLLVEGRVWVAVNGVASFDYSFNVQPVVDDAPLALDLGARIDGVLAVPGQTDTYTFTLGEAKALYFDALAGRPFSWTLVGPAGVVVSRSFGASDAYEIGGTNPLLQLAAGSYTLRIDANGDTVGDYAFRLADVAAEAASIGLSTAIAGALDTARSTRFYKFEATAGERYFFDSLSYSGGYSDTTYRLIAPDGTQAWGGYGWMEDRDVAAFAQTGTYWLLVEGRIDNAQTPKTFGFNIQKVSDLQATLNIGATVAATLDHVGQRAVYSFSLTEARRLLFDALAPNNNQPDFRWSLIGPRGAEVNGRQLYSSESYELGGTSPLLDLIAGDYQLIVDPINEQLGSFAFRLLDLADATPIQANTLVAGALQPANQTQAYRFDASAGVDYYIDRQQLSSGVGADWLTWRLFDNYGRQIFGPQNLNDVDLFTLPHDGVYTLIVEGRVWDTQYTPAINYSFKLLEITDDLYDIEPGVSFGVDRNFTPGKIGGAAALGGLRTLEVANSADTNQTGSMTFETWFRADTLSPTWQALAYKGNGNSNQRTYSLWLNSAGYLHLSTGDGGNQTIQTAAGLVTAGEWYHVAAVIDRAGGVMKLYLNGVEVASGAVRTTAARESTNPLQIGASIESDSYVFRGAIDDFRLWSVARTGAQIAAQFGAALQGDEAGLVTYLKADESSGTRLADATGRGNDGNVRFAWDASVGVVAGVLTFGQKDIYRFTLSEETLLYFDSLTDDSRLRWTLVGPQGTVFSDKSMQSSDSADGTTIHTLAAGAYTLTIDGQGDATGEYGFRLLKLADAAPLAMDTSVSGELTPANQTNAYRFTAAAGERIYFDVEAYSGGYPFWRLLDPFGRTVWGPNYMPSDDVQVQTLALAGVYTLLVEGRRDAGPGRLSYTLRAQRVVDRTQNITLDGEYGVDPVWGEGRIGGAIGVNGLQAATVADDAALDFNRAFTIEAWVKVDSYANTWTPIFYKGNANDPDARVYSAWLQSNGSIWFGVRDASGQQAIQTAGGLIPAGEWHHLAVVMDRDAQQMRVLVDGVVQRTGSVRNADNLASADPLYLGTNVEPGNDYANLRGSLDEIRLWNVARSTDQIAAAKDAAVDAASAGLVAYLKADATSGRRVVDATGRGHDLVVSSRATPVVAGRIESIGQRVFYNFDLTQPNTRLYFDALLNSGSVVWSLSGPRGLVVADRRFDQSDSQNGTSIFDLPPGSYTLTVDGLRDTTGSYAFRLLDLGSATALTPGTAVDGTLAPGNRTDAYSFDVAAGERFFFQNLSTAGGPAYWRLLDPFGRAVWGPEGVGTDIGTLELALAGRYTLLVEGRRDAGGDIPYRFNVQRVADSSAALVLGSVVNGNIAQAGARADYSFSLAAAAQLVFDSRLNQPGFRWSLTGPRGTVVSARSMSQSDSADFGANPVLQLAAGDYTLSIDPDADLTGAFAFRLVDLANASDVEPLTLGATLSGTLDPGSQTRFYRFDGNARDRLFFDLISESRNSAYWRLIAPTGEVVFGPSNVDDLYATLPASGRYVLLVEGRINEGSSVDYSLRVSNTAPAGNGATAQNFDAAGLPYVTTAYSSAEATVESGGPSGSFLRLLPGSVTGINSVGFNSTGIGVIPATVSVDFDLRITRVSNQGDGIGFAWLNADAWGNAGAAPQFAEEPNLARSFGVGFDPVNNGEVSDNHLSLHFDGTKLADFNLTPLMPGFRFDDGSFHHARVVMTAVAGGSNVSVYLTPAGGSEVAVVQNYFVSGMQAYDGRVAFGARNGGWRAHNDIDNVAVAVTPGAAEVLPQVTLGEAVNATLGAATERDRYTFTLTEATRVYFDTLSTRDDSYYLWWSMSGPDGRVPEPGKRLRSSDSDQGTSIYDLGPGTYTLSFWGENNFSGAYSFALRNLGAATAITPGETVSGSLGTGNETRAYAFDAQAGQRVYFDLTARSGGDLRWRLLDPFGNTLFGPAVANGVNGQDVGPVELAQAGRYTLLFEGRYNRSDNTSFSFVVQPLQDSSAALQLGQVVNASIAKGQSQRYNFTLTGDVRAYFDSLTRDVAGADSYYLSWSLSGPRGTVVADRPFRQSDSYDGSSILDLVAGDYTLTVTSTNEIAGNYSFRLADLAQATAIATGVVVDGTLAPSNETDVYRFDAAAGESFYFDRISRNGGDIYWRLLDPYGRTVFGPTYIDSDAQIGVRTLEVTGSYTLLVEGRYYTAGDASYSFRVQPVQNETLALNLNEVQNQSIAHKGQVDTFTFSLAEAKRVYFDSLTADVSGADSWYLRWSLEGPTGVLVSDQPFRGSDSYEGLSVFDLGPGDYRLTVRGTNDIAGNYAFRLLDLSSAPLLATGTPVSGVLNPASETEAYRFAAAAGDRFYFDRTVNSGGDTYWRLLDPFGWPTSQPC